MSILIFSGRFSVFSLAVSRRLCYNFFMFVSRFVMLAPILWSSCYSLVLAWFELPFVLRLCLWLISFFLFLGTLFQYFVLSLSALFIRCSLAGASIWKKLPR